MPRFVLLLHARPDGSSHYDLLLERGDALAAWRLPAPPAELSPEDAAVERLPDHRTAYLTYEGEVSGGRGTVRRMDAGTCEVEAWGDDRVAVRLAGAHARGLLELAAQPDGAWRARFGA
jgi:hypothetical protein